jgi:large subunit ribosomal protein L31
MKENIHPDYRPVLFIDQAAPAPNNWMLISSTVNTKEKGVCPVDGKEYPMVKVPISSFTHRLWTGAVQFLDTEGRLEKFANKFKRKAEQQVAELVKQEEANKEKAKATKKKK